ncbi:hypothetical protein V7150_25195 [Neobacillus drentensis]|uniref:hypothetical protein n=1 Tax=Neobacillus drentensis TaxID=220684 RepID=UPI002FFDFB1A
MNKNKIEELLKIAEKGNEMLVILPCKFEHTENGKILLDPHKKFDKDWFENDKAYNDL